MENDYRLILINQFKLLAIQDPESREDYENKIEILQKGYVIDYDDLYGELSEETPIEVSGEVLNIVTMYRYMKNAIDALTPEQKQENEELLVKIKFRGFDGNNDEHYGYFKEIAERPHDFHDLNDWPTNSHSQSDLPRYRSMLRVHRELMDEPNYRWGLSELKRIAAAV